MNITFFSCKDEWNDHYSATSLQKSDMTLYQYIHSRPDFARFDSMLHRTGYDSILNQSQTFTVWVPLDSTLVNVNLNDSVAIRRIVENHITKYSHPTVEIHNANKVMTMINKKLLTFGMTNGKLSLDGNIIVEPDHAMKNGIIHVINKFVPYKTNFWEFLNEATGIDEFKSYINSLTTKELNTNLSYNNGVFVDSVFKYTNKVTDNLAALSNEDSIYTALFPTNTAWNEAYSRISPYFNSLPDKKLPNDSGAIYQDKITKWTLVRDVFFRGNLRVPVGVPSLLSTYGTEFVSPDRLFSGSQSHEMSNGTCYKTDLLNYTATETWNKKIVIEAESSYYGRTFSNYAGSNVSSIGTGLNISDGYYLNMTPTTSSSLSTLFVQFPMPNTLSTKYNLYCVFVPTVITDTLDHRPYKVKFYINYVDNKNLSGTLVPSGFPVVKATVDVNNTLQLPSKTSNTFITDGKTVQKMLVVKNLSLPFCNIFQNSKSPINFSLIVQNATGTTKAETDNYNRNVRIDCIILEPVQ